MITIKDKETTTLYDDATTTITKPSCINSQNVLIEGEQAHVHLGFTSTVPFILRLNGNFEETVIENCGLNISHIILTLNRNNQRKFFFNLILQLFKKHQVFSYQTESIETFISIYRLIQQHKHTVTIFYSY
ncbi:hypothetical protein RF11_05084 [Thelohanellus kitauei]|uniref:Uncharacterized protein n=1 Tax=Thelohanellus kitauei TaxID=669202 RepID=A0A0C2NDI0_THEKT|nr:hypothetical protein RF11_05084 [Thelohanellus kitauei]